jgi:hypothetical protein
MRILLSLAMILAFSCAAVATAAEADDPVVEIPLKDVLALDMPGTLDIRELNTPEDPIVDQVLKQISESRKYDHCFAMRGEGADALRQFLRMRGDHDYWNRLPADQPISLVFFTRPIHEDVVLHHIERRGRGFNLQYRFAPSNAAEASPRLAIIPVGKLPVGDYGVEVERSPAEAKHVSAGFEEPPPERYGDVCASCLFKVVEGPGGPPPPADLVEIPLKDVWATECLARRI